MVREPGGGAVDTRVGEGAPQVHCALFVDAACVGAGDANSRYFGKLEVGEQFWTGKGEAGA